MLRELNENEMEMVSGGNGHPGDEVAVTASRIDWWEFHDIYTLLETRDDSVGPSWGGGWGRNDTGPTEAAVDVMQDPLGNAAWLVDQLGGWMTENGLWGCLAPIRISSSCGN